MPLTVGEGPYIKMVSEADHYEVEQSTLHNKKEASLWLKKRK
jgi:hypothetical protein